ncbi:MAG: hypothetical protein LBK08_07195 [Treponema sp.]|jgi:hypothetical protein|nr:hypothetical protein [Treponema sp.]
MKGPRISARIKAALLLVLFFSGSSLGAYFVTYKEQYYRLYHIHYNQYPDDTMENIYWLEKAAKASFCNPLYALALIENEKEWEKYRYLFNMHISLKLAEQYLYLGNKWNKRRAYFYNAPWKEQNLESLETAETCFKTALYYWQEAETWAEKTRESSFRYINLVRIQNWEDEAFRMESGSLDYGKTIGRELRLLEDVRGRFQATDENTY